MGLLLLPALTQAQTQTALQGDVALQMARLLGLEAGSSSQAIASLTKLGIIPPSGWVPGMQVSQQFINSLFNSLNRAVRAGAVTPPTSLADPSAIMASVLASSGLPSWETVRYVENAGGERSKATLGAARGQTAASPPAAKVEGTLQNGTSYQECPGHRERPDGSGTGSSGCVPSPTR